MRTLTVTTPFADKLTIRKVTGYEGISALYEFTLVLSSQDANLSAHDIIGQSACVHLTINAAQDGKAVFGKVDAIRHLHGLVTDFGYLHEDDDELGYHLYTCTLRPMLWQLGLCIDSRVFVQKSVLQIAEILLGEAGIDYKITCTASYRSYGHSMQYQESSLDYLHRLFSNEGIYYYFEHSDNKHTLILTDNNASHPTIITSKLPYHSKHSAGAPSIAYIDEWQETSHLTTSSVMVNDHNYNTASAKLNATTTTHSFNASATEHYDFYSNFKTGGDAAHYGQVKAESYTTKTQEVHAKGNALAIACGHLFSLTRHPRDEANSDYLITQVFYELQEAGYTTGDETSLYRIRFHAIPKSHQYRAQTHNPNEALNLTPVIIDAQAAMVTGPAGEEVYTNEYGDIKLQFHWDRYGPNNEMSSDWVRVIQASAGMGFGSINTPRIGEEVLVHFIGGHPDRPIVIGRLYNSDNTPPWGFPAAAKQSGIKSKSFNSPLENFNEMMFDDTQGNELVNFQAQKDLTSLVKNDETRTVNHDRTTTIDNDETVTVHGNRTETVDKDETITIHQNRTETVDKDETITIHENRKERVDKDETISIGGSRSEVVEGDEKIDIQGSRDKIVQKNDTLTVKQNQKHTINKNKSLTVNKNSTETVKIAKSVTVGTVYATQVGTVMNTAVGMMQAEEIGMIKKTMVGKSYGIAVGEQFQIKVGDSSLILNSDGSIVLQGKSILIQAEKDNTLIGNDVHINPEGVWAKDDDESKHGTVEEYDENAMGAWAEQSTKDAIERNGLWAGPVTQSKESQLLARPTNAQYDKYPILTNRMNKDDRFLGEAMAMRFLIANNDNADLAWSQIRNYRNSYPEMREDVRNAEHYLYSLNEVRKNSYEWGLMHAKTVGYSVVKGAVNIIGVLDEPYSGRNNSPFRNSPATIEEVKAGSIGANDGLYGISRE